MPPEVLATLKRYGLNASDIARALRVSRNTISQWSRGLRTMSQEVQADLWELADLVRTEAAQGRDARQALAQWQPTVVITPWGRDRIAEAHGGSYDIPEDLAKELRAVVARGGAFREQQKIHLEAACRAIGQAGPEAGTIEGRMRLRRALQAAAMILADLNRREALQEEPRR
jgi:transcriptional regulator with XRE-family HTH domain